MTNAALPGGDVLVSSSESFVCMFLRSRRCLDLLEMCVAIGPSDGRHANREKQSIY